MSSLAVIPARGGSTRLKDKNIHPLCGKPLIRWVVEAVVNSDSFDSVIVSTDSDKIFEAVSDLGVTRHCRPEHLATTQSTVLDAMLNLMETSEKYDTFSYFLPTCPFITSEDIRAGVELLGRSAKASVISMTEMKETVQLACLMKEGWVLPVFDNLEQGLTNSKYIKKYYKPSGAFYMGYWDTILKNKSFFKGDVKGVVVPEERSVDINNAYDIAYAESLR
jgi:CMP-N-acetylneuraminic acid synthetase